MKGVMAVLALCSALLVARSSYAAQAMLQYRSPQFHYTVTYPASWLPIDARQVPGADFVAVSSDRNDFVSVSVAPGRQNAVEVLRALGGAFAPFGRQVFGPTYRPFRIHGATGTLAQGAVMASNGKMSLVLAFMLSRHGLIYLALGVVRDVGAPTSADVAAARAFISDIAIV